jgi:hypothetical protein
MGASYDPINDRVLLTGDGTGWSRMKKAILAPPAGTDQAIYVMRYWFDSMAAFVNILDSDLAWDSAFHLGLNFNATHPVKPITTGLAAANAGYTDFFGISQFAQDAAALDDATTSTADSDALRDDYACLAFSTTMDQLVSKGNGTASQIKQILDPEKAADEMPYTLPRNETFGLAATYVHRVFSDEINESVHHQGWLNVDSLDLSTFDLQTDLDPDAPKVSIPVSNSWEDNSVLNGAAEVGTNWRPSSGVMAFPAYFMARFPMSGQQLVIDYLGVQYSTQGVVS